MGSTNIGLIVIVFVFFVISNLQSMVHCNSIQDLDDLIRSYASRGNTTRHTGPLYAISLPSNLSDIKASIVTVRNSMFWRKGANVSGIYIPPKVKTTPYAKRIVLVYENIGDQSSSVYFRLSDNYSFVSPVIGFSVYDATNTNDLKRLNLSIKRDNPILIQFIDPSVSQTKVVKCVAFGDKTDDRLLKLSNTTRNYECATTNSLGHYALVVLNRKTNSKPELVRRKWWFVFLVIGTSVVAVMVIVVVVKLVRKKRLREMERESEKSEMIGDIWIGRSRMPAATMVRTQPSLEYHEDLPPSTNIP